MITNLYVVTVTPLHIGHFGKGGLYAPYPTHRKYNVPRQGRGKRKRYANFRGYAAAADSQ